MKKLITICAICVCAIAGLALDASAVMVLPIADTGNLIPSNIAINQLTGDIYVTVGASGVDAGVSKVAGGGVTPVYGDIDLKDTDGLAVGGNYLFWGTNSGLTSSKIFRAPESGSGPIATIYTGSTCVDYISDLAYQDDRLYCPDYYGGRIGRLNSDGSSPVKLTDYRFYDKKYVSVALSADKIFEGDNAGIYSTPIGGGGFTTLATGNFGDIAFLNDVNDVVYAIGGDGVSIWQVPANGGTATPIVEGSPFGSLDSIAAYNGMLYVTDSGLHKVWQVVLAPVPEPVTIGLLGLGSLALLRRRKK